MSSNPPPAHCAILICPGGTTGAVWEAIRAIRTEVFLQEQAIPPEEEWDELDNHPQTIHLLALSLPPNSIALPTEAPQAETSSSQAPKAQATLSQTLQAEGLYSGEILLHPAGPALGTARCFLDPAGPTPEHTAAPAWRIGRMAVLKSARGQGHGLTLLKAALEQARRQPTHPTRALLSAQTHALPFYRQAGFKEFGEIHMDAGIPHRWMQKPL